MDFADEEDDVRPLEASKETEMENLTKRLLSLRKERRKLEKELESTIEEYFPPLSDGPGKDEAEAALVEVKKLYYERMGNFIFGSSMLSYQFTSINYKCSM